MNDLLNKLAAELKRDWRRTGVLAALLVVGVVMVIRQFGGGGEPAQANPRDPAAAANRPDSVPGWANLPATDQPINSPSHPTDSASGLPKKVFRFAADVTGLNAPRRDPFLANLEDFPPDPDAPKAATTAPLSPADAADAEAHRRAAQEDTIRAEAQKLHLQSTLMAYPPQAMIGKDIFRVGQHVGPFLLTRITSDSVTLEKDGFELILKLENRASAGRE